MTARECFQILREIKDAAFATTDEEGRPHNRIIDVMLVEEEKLYFCTARTPSRPGNSRSSIAPSGAESFMRRASSPSGMIS